MKTWIDQGATWPDHASNEGGEEEQQLGFGAERELPPDAAPEAIREALGAFADEDQNISALVAKLPGTLNQTADTLGKVDTLADQIGGALFDGGAA